MTQPDNRDLDALLAALAVRLTAGSARGHAPDLDEIERFRLGEVFEPRRGEVLSHLAHDPACFQLLHALENAEAHLGAVERRLSSEPDQAGAKGRRAWSRRLLPRRRRRRRPRRIIAWGSGLAGALAAVLALVAVLPLLPVYQAQYAVDAGYRQLDAVDRLRPSDWPGLGGPRAKAFGFDLSPTTGRAAPGQRIGFKAGVRQGLDSLVSDDPRWARVIDCPAALNAGLPMAGSSMPLAHGRCRGGRALGGDDSRPMSGGPGGDHARVLGRAGSGAPAAGGPWAPVEHALRC